MKKHKLNWKLLTGLVLLPTAALAAGCEIDDTWGTEKTDEQLEQEFKSDSRECGLEHGHLSAGEALDCRVDYIEQNLDGREISATGVMSQNSDGKVLDLDMYSVDVSSMVIEGGNYRLVTDIQGVGSIWYPDGLRTTSRVDIEKEEL